MICCYMSLLKTQMVTFRVLQYFMHPSKFVLRQCYLARYFKASLGRIDLRVLPKNNNLLLEMFKNWKWLNKFAGTYPGIRKDAVF